MANSNSTSRVALYARISTRDKHEDPETQLHALREYASNRKLVVAGEYVDMGISGSKDRRPQLEKLMAAARRRECDSILVARFDRFARSVRHLVVALDEFQALEIDFISLSESIDTSIPMGKMVFTVIGAVAELEKSPIRERVMMGLSRAKAQGKKLGRPAGSRMNIELLHTLRAEGLSIREISKQLQVSKSTVPRLLRAVP